MNDNQKMRLALGGAALLAVALGLWWMPDFVRYMKIERM